MQRFRIVIADDNAAVLEQIVAVIGAEFDVVATATDGLSALDLARQYKPDLVILDINMPGLTGIDVCSQLTNDPGNVPVVICSVENDPEVMQAAKRAGALGYVLKSRFRRDLIPAIKLVLQKPKLVLSAH